MDSIISQASNQLTPGIYSIYKRERVANSWLLPVVLRIKYIYCQKITLNKYI